MIAGVEAFIGMGSNLGDGVTILSGAWQRLGEIEGIGLIALSSPYKTAPVDMTSQHWFTNSVGKIETDLPPLELLRALLQVEADFGRKRDAKTFGYQDRALDLDLLFCGDEVLDTPELILPHPRIRDRLFVLVPLLELAPELKSPLSGELISDMEKQLRENISGSKYNRQELVRGSWKKS